MSKRVAVVAALVVSALVVCYLFSWEREYELGETGKLAGRNLKSYYAIFLGLEEGVCPEKIDADWEFNLKKLWERKLRVSPGKPVVKRASREIPALYSWEKATRLSLREYIEIADEEARILHQCLDWERVGRLRLYNSQKKQVNERKLELLREICGEMGGKELVAYAMTELLPSVDGKFNYHYLDFLLRNAGREYVESLPAVYDKKTSFGPFQFTEYALYDVKGERRGASSINQALPADCQIPGSVIKLRGNDHFKAAYLFAVDNLALFIRGLDDKQVATLEKVWSSRLEEVVAFTAVSHHAPSSARTWAGRWLSEGADQEFSEYCNEACALYARKTKSNYSAL